MTSYIVLIWICQKPKFLENGIRYSETENDYKLNTFVLPLHIMERKMNRSCMQVTNFHSALELISS